MGLWWMYCGWAGFLFHKLGGMTFLAGIGRILQNKFHAMGRAPVHQQTYSQTTQQATQSRSTSTDREDSYRQEQEEYRQREWQREQENAHEQDQAERFTQEQRQAEEERQRAEEQKDRRKSTHKEETPPKSKPKPDPAPKQEEPPPPKPKPKRTRFWWEVLEVSEHADQATIKKAYRTLIQKYHPDRVSHLGEEFQVIAEEKTKELNGAFDTAKKKRS
jgi:DnaJ-domain-containing protein 1